MFVKKSTPNVTYGEIDVMEHVGYNVNYTTATEHIYLNGKKIKSISSGAVFYNSNSTFHIFRVDWNSTCITTYIDSKPFFVYLKSALPSDVAWPFDQPLYIIINMAGN